MEGWIKIHRKIMQWEWKAEPNMVALWVDLLCRANHAPHRWQGVDVDRGQCVVGLKSLSVSTGLSVRSVRTCLYRLKSASQVTIQSNNRYSLVSIINYDGYQCNDADETEASDKPADKQATSKRQASDKRTTTNKNDKNDKNDKNKELPTIPPEEIKKPYPEPLYHIRLSDNDVKRLTAVMGEARLQELIEEMETWAIDSPVKFKKKKDHARTLMTWFRRARERSASSINLF